MAKRKKKIKFIEKPFLRGRLSYRIYKNGVPVGFFADSNLIVNTARLQMAHLVAGDVGGRSIVSIALGTSGNMATVDDTEITGAFIKPVDCFEYPGIDRVKINWEILESEANGMAIREFGLITEDGGLFARKIRDEPINKLSDMAIEGEWTIYF